MAFNIARSSNPALRTWIRVVAEHTQPACVHWCDGNETERAALETDMVAAGSLIELDSEAHPRSFLHRSDPTDVARTEQLTFISTEREEEVGPTNNWMSRKDAEARVWSLFAGAMKGRTMYVVPYLMGPVGSPHENAIDLSGMDFPKDRLFELLAVDGSAWLKEALRTLEFLARLEATSLRAFSQSIGCS